MPLDLDAAAQKAKDVAASHLPGGSSSSTSSGTTPRPPANMPAGFTLTRISEDTFGTIYQDQLGGLWRTTDFPNTRNRHMPGYAEEAAKWVRHPSGWYRMNVPGQSASSASPPGASQTPAQTIYDPVSGQTISVQPSPEGARGKTSLAAYVPLLGLGILAAWWMKR